MILLQHIFITTRGHGKNLLLIPPSCGHAENFTRALKAVEKLRIFKRNLADFQPKYLSIKSLFSLVTLPSLLLSVLSLSRILHVQMMSSLPLALGFLKAKNFFLYSLKVELC